MEDFRSWEANSISAVKKFSNFYGLLNFVLMFRRACQFALLWGKKSSPNPPSLFKIHFNIMLRSTTRSSKCSFSFRICCNIILLNFSNLTILIIYYYKLLSNFTNLLPHCSMIHKLTELGGRKRSSQIFIHAIQGSNFGHSIVMVFSMFLLETDHFVHKKS